MKKILLLLSIPLLFTACIDIDNVTPDNIGSIEGLRPIYLETDDWQTVSVEAPRNISRLGKIYYKYPYIYVNESNEGIHLIDNSDPTNPIFLKFIRILGNEDIAIKGNYLYADNVNDLVVLDIADLDNISLVNRVPNVYEPSGQDFPEGHQGYFECVDPSRGQVIGWQPATLDNPQCFR